MTGEKNKNALYRLNLLLTLLNSDEYSYSIIELESLTGIPKAVIYDDIISIMSDTELSIVIYAVDEEYESFEYSKVFEKELKAGRYDDVEIACTVPYQKEISVALTNQEMVALSDFLKARNYKLMGRRENFLIKNNISEINDHDYKVMQRLSGYIDKKKPCRVVYVSKDKVVYSDNVYPLKILFDVDNNFTYLAFLKDDLAFYRLDRIKQVEDAKGDHSFDASKIEAAHEMLKMMWGAEISEPINVKIKIYDEHDALERVIHDLGAKAEGHISGPFSSDEGDYYIYEDKVIGIYKFASWVRSYGSSVIVLEPQSLAEMMIASAKKKLAYYG